MELATLTSKGQITIPVSLRRRMGIDTGDQLVFYEDGGRIVVAPMSAEALKAASDAAQRERILTIEEIRRICTPVAEKANLLRLTLFGSYARGEAGRESDVDLYIETEEKMSFLKLGGLQAEFEDALGKRADLLTPGGLTSFLESEIKKDGIILYERNEP